MFTKWLDKGWNYEIYDWWSDKYVRSCSMTGFYFDPWFCFFILIMYILFVEKIKKRVAEWNKRFNLSLLISPSLPFLKIILCEGPNIFDIHVERTWGGLEICGVFTDSIVFKQQIYRSFLQMGGRCGGGVKKLVIFCGCHNCIIPNVKKVMFLALVPVLK